ncbi:hypothetical protein EYF80_042782 [Liparis tanakae]|uniref:Uncharacterized protein n=1 Tax=Liparis tanakae TaxID=230148 RepID=A0A4Z2G164_9TELE|nr:hypothetical protein EYF80_042782 [Liparis tanakae]
MCVCVLGSTRQRPLRSDYSKLRHWFCYRHGGLLHDAHHGLPGGPAARVRLWKCVRHRRRGFLLWICFWSVYRRSRRREHRLPLADDHHRRRGYPLCSSLHLPQESTGTRRENCYFDGLQLFNEDTVLLHTGDALPG